MERLGPQEALLLARNYASEGAARRRTPPVCSRPGPAADPECPDEALRLIDGLMLAGGADIDPAAYGRESTPRDDRNGPRARCV